MSKLPLIVVLGPTAVGKTETTIQLALRTNGEIISADASIFYKGMDIGTAKPTLDEQTRVPHHLIDVTEPDNPWSLGKFQKEVFRLVGEIHQRRQLPYLVGGTGQYIRSIVDGWTIPKQRSDSRLREVLEHIAERSGLEILHNWLTVLDPNAAAGIDYRNLRRTIRALEVILKSGHRFSETRRREEPRFEVFQLGLVRPRDELYSRVDFRIEKMFEKGLVAEVARLLTMYPPDLQAFSAIGYQEVIQYLQGDITIEDAKVLMKRRTRQFVRRQANWFKPTDPNINWFQMHANTLELLEDAVRGFLGSL